MYNAVFVILVTGDYFLSIYSQTDGAVMGAFYRPVLLNPSLININYTAH